MFCSLIKREESVIEQRYIVNENMFFGLMLMNKVIMLVFTLKNLTVKTKSISIIDVYTVYILKFMNIIGINLC